MSSVIVCCWESEICLESLNLDSDIDLAKKASSPSHSVNFGHRLGYILVSIYGFSSHPCDTEISVVIAIIKEVKTRLCVILDNLFVPWHFPLQNRYAVRQSGADEVEVVIMICHHNLHAIRGSSF